MKPYTPPYEHFEAEEEEEEPEFKIGSKKYVMLSAIIKKTKIAIDMDDIVEIGEVLEYDDAPQWIDIEQVELEDGGVDYKIIPLQSFEQTELAIATEKDVAFVLLKQAKVREAATEGEPTIEPTVVPTEEPTEAPTEEPTAEPTAEPTNVPTTIPATEPTEEPTSEPTLEPTIEPTTEPSVEPTVEITEKPTVAPAEDATEEPATEPTEEPTSEPVLEPTTEPTTKPSVEPTVEITEEPTVVSSEDATEEPTLEPTVETSEAPTVDQSEEPTAIPSEEPTSAPIDATDDTVEQATAEPSAEPTEVADTEPTPEPTAVETDVPTAEPDTTATATIEPVETPNADSTEEPTESTEAPSMEPDVTPTETENTTDDMSTAAPAEEFEHAPMRYAAVIDVSEETAPFSLNALMEYAEPIEIETAETEESYEATEVDIASNTEDQSADIQTPAEATEDDAWELEYDTSLLAIESLDGDYIVTPTASFDTAQIVVRHGAEYILTLVNWNASEKEESIDALDLGLAVITATEGTLPSEATGHAYALSGEEADDARSMVELFLAAHAGPKKAKGFTPVQSAGETQYRVFEIGIDNVEYENGFHVEVTLPQAVSGQEDSYRLYHIHEGEVTPIDSFEKTFRAVGNRQVLTGFAFDTDEFSQFVLSYTVDFYYGEYEYHLEGEGEILLSSLFALLGIEQDISNVEFVEFTNAELIKVQKLALNEGQDWLLTSLEPFDSTEWLTVVFSNGNIVEIKIEDARIQTTILTANGETWLIAVEYGADADIPENVSLEVFEISVNSEEWRQYYTATKDALNQINTLQVESEKMFVDSFISESPESATIMETLVSPHFFDIRLMADNEKIEPKAPVQVTIRYTEATPIDDNMHPMVVHFADSGIELIEPDTSSTENTETIDTFCFEQTSFSVSGSFYQAQDMAALQDGEKYLIMSKGTDANGNSIWRVLCADESTNYTITGPGNYTVGQIAKQFCDSTCVWSLKNNDIFDYGTNQWTKSYELYNEETKSYLALQGNNNTSENLLSQSSINLGIGLEKDKKFWIGNGWNWNGSSWNWNGDSTSTHYLGILNTSNQFYVNKSPDSKQGFEFHQIFPMEITDNSPLPEPKQPNTALLDQFKNELNSSIPIRECNKTAEVYDYDNRIYQIDLTAKSSYRAMDQDIELAFITDISNSMLFASSLTNTGNTYKYTTGYNNTIVGDVSGFTDKDQVYILIGDPSSESTHYAVFWDGENYINGQWVAVDASYYAKYKYWKATGVVLKDSKGRSPEDWWGKTRIPSKLKSEVPPKFNPDTVYPIYTPTDGKWLNGFGDIFSVTSNAQNRLYYLKQNVKFAIDAMKIVAGTSEESTVRVALETFCKSVPNNGFDFTDVKNLNSLDSYLNSISTADGTNQRWALKMFNEGTNGYDYAKNWSKSDGKKKYVIMISDGAPNVKSGAEGMELKNTAQNVGEQAKLLEDKGARVFSIALSMGDVDLGKRIMAAIATDSNEDYYCAENENEFAYAFYDILRKMIAEATIVGQIEDTIDECFYPVDKNGQVLSDGDYIDTNGATISEPSDKERMPYGQIQKVPLQPLE